MLHNIFYGPLQVGFLAQQIPVRDDNSYTLKAGWPCCHVQLHLNRLAEWFDCFFCHLNWTLLGWMIPLFVKIRQHSRTPVKLTQKKIKWKRTMCSSADLSFWQNYRLPRWPKKTLSLLSDANGCLPILLPNLEQIGRICLYYRQGNHWIIWERCS